MMCTASAVAAVAAIGICTANALAQSVPAVRVMVPATRAVAASEAAGAGAAADPDAMQEATPGMATTLPGAVAPGAPGAVGAAGGLTPAEVAELKAIFESLSESEQEEMRAYYADLSIDLDAALGLGAARNALAQRGQMISGAMRELDFQRKPAAVLAARAKLGFGQVPNPNPDIAPPQDIAKWLHLQVMAGEWGTFASYLAARPLVESEPVYAAIMQAMNRGDAGLLPEEVLAFAEASPSPFKPWQMTALGKMLQGAAAKYSTGAMLNAIRTGTRLFGPQDEQTRRRTVEFLVGGGLVVPAYEFLPSLTDARAAADGAQLLVHARYKLDLAEKAGETPEAEALRLDAWQILCDAALLERETFANRREAVRLAIEQMNHVPRAQVAPWLAQVFASPQLGPAALEIMALTASSIGDMKLEVEQRANAILGLKEAVDVLLARDDVDSATLRVPLRMMTAALVAEMEQTIVKKGGQRVIAREAQLLLRAIPSEKWLRALEPSLATRARKACTALATIADETDMALALLRAAVAQSPAEAAEYADDFLQKWKLRLSPQQEYPPEMMQYFAFYRDAMPMAPLTRGRQHRNLDRLAALVGALRAAGVEPRNLPSLVPAFQACHALTEVYDRDDIERIFGTVEAMPPQTAALLANTMGASLNGDWRSRAAQKATGTKRSDTEVALLVDRGYGLALELAESALAHKPGSWDLAAMKAALTYDRMQFKQQQTAASDPAKANEYRKAAFDAFGQAAAAYVAALAKGEVRDDPTVHLRWFGAAMGTAELNFLRADDLPKEGTLQDDQIDLIRKSLQTLPAEAYDRHLAAMAGAVQGAVERADPEVKPRLVHHALRVIGDHPAGASLRSMEELYRDLVKEEIKLRIALDGADRVGVGQPFGVLLSLRFTHSVDRETGGFAKYLQNGVFARVGNSYRQINYRDQVQKAIEAALTRQFDVDAIGFFDPFMPARGVVEEGKAGWLEKPMAYVVLTRKDPVVDKVPSVVLDMQFTDQTGPVTLALPSNTPLLEAGDAHAARPVKDLSISQLVDVRSAGAGAAGAKEQGAVTLEVRLRGSGVLPDLRSVLDGLDTAIAGYTLAPEAITADPPIIVQTGEAQNSRMAMMMGTTTEPKDGYPEPDADGMYRMPIERTYRVTYTRNAEALGSAFVLPTLKPGVDAKLESRAYSDLDIVPVVGPSVAVVTGWWTAWRIAGTVAIAAVLVGVLLVARRLASRVTVEPRAAWAPARVTPLGVVTSLRRLERERGAALTPERAESLRKEIAALERKYFGPGAAESTDAELRTVVERWTASASA